MRETRVTIILTRLARKVRENTGNNRYRARAEDQTPTLRALIWTSCTRPMSELQDHFSALFAPLDQYCCAPNPLS
jgi:hypothetical protein